MKKTFKTMLSLLMALVLALSLGVTAFAQSTQSAADIVFTGKKLVVTAKTTDHTTTDLFGNFKGMMPGDTRTEKITFKNESSTPNTDYVKLYIVAKPHTDENQPVDTHITQTVDKMNEFLAKFTMTVKQNGKEIFNAKPNKEDTFAPDGYLLGTFKKGEGTTLEVALTLPIETDNEFANLEGEVDWTFLAVEFTRTPGKPPTVTPGSPKTGDETNLFLYAGLCAVSLGMITVLVLNRKAAKREK